MKFRLFLASALAVQSALAQSQAASEGAGISPPAQPAPNATTVPASVAVEVIDPRAEYHKGNAAFREGRLTAARFHYRRSVESQMSFDAMCNLGRTETGLGDDVAAYEHLSKCLELHPTDSELIESRAKFDELRREVETRMTAEQRDLARRRLALFPLAHSGGGPLTPADVPPSQSSARLPVVLTVAGVGVVGMGVGVGLFVLSGDRAREAEDLRQQLLDAGAMCTGTNIDPRCEQLQSALRSSDQAQNAAVATLGISGGLLACALVGYLIWPKGSSVAESLSARQVALSSGGSSAPNGQSTRSGLSSPGTSAGPLREVRPLLGMLPSDGGAFVGFSGRF